MPLFVIERRFAEELELTGNDVWLYSFLSADRRQSYCLYEAPSAEAIVAASKRAQIPADAIVEVGAAAPELHDRLGDWTSRVAQK